MEEYVMSLLRQIMIDRALERRDFETLRRLTQPNWHEHVVADYSAPADPYRFLERDRHFLDKRLIDDSKHKQFINYRFQDKIDEIVHIGEIRIPLHPAQTLETKFQSRPKLESNIEAPPNWFLSLIRQATVVFREYRSGDI